MTKETITWHELISEAMLLAGESWDDVEAHTLSEAELREVFDGSWGSPNGVPFTLWTHNRVYFPASYDGWEWVGSAPRHVSDEKTEHIGNE